MRYITQIRPRTCCAFFFFFTSSQREIKIIFQTFTTSGTSKPPVPHLFYFCFSFSTLPSPLSAFFRLCKWKGIEEKRALGSRSGNRVGGVGEESVLLASTSHSGVPRCPNLKHNPKGPGDGVKRPERGGHTAECGTKAGACGPQTD